MLGADTVQADLRDEMDRALRRAMFIAIERGYLFSAKGAFSYQPRASP
jgi:hypothetical protein